MPELNWWIILQILWLVFSLLFLGGIGFLLWKARGVFHWRRTLKEELEEIKSQREEGSEHRKEALDLVVDKAESILYSHSPDMTSLAEELPEYVKSIATCYHPDSEHPEMEITLARALGCLDQSTGRLSEILQRPGFSQLKKVKVHHVRRSWQWYRNWTEKPWVKWMIRQREKLHKITVLRLIVLPDPFSWAAYLSHRLSIMLLTKYFLLDLYLFSGKMALTAYDEEEDFLEEGEEELEEIFEELQALPPTTEAADSEIVPLRKELTGFTSTWINPTGFKDWKEAVQKAAVIIATRHFPDSDHPLEEAALGPLLESTRSWLNSLAQGKELTGVGKLYHLRLSTIFYYGALGKTVADYALPKTARPWVKKAWKVYGKLEWPRKIYKWIRRASPMGAALGLGWMVAKRSLRSYVVGRSFDMACEEIEKVYYNSLSDEEKKQPVKARELPKLPRPEKKTEEEI